MELRLLRPPQSDQAVLSLPQYAGVARPLTPEPRSRGLQLMSAERWECQGCGAQFWPVTRPLAKCLQCQSPDLRKVRRGDDIDYTKKIRGLQRKP